MINKTSVKLNDQEFTVKKSYRSFMLFEELSGGSVTEIKDSLKHLILLFYCILRANNPETFKYTYEQFIDVLDENPEAMDVFNSYLTSEYQNAADTPEKKTKLL